MKEKLIKEVQQYYGRFDQEFSDQVPSLIEKAVMTVFNDPAIYDKKISKSINIELAPNQAFMSAPNDWRETYSIFLLNERDRIFLQKATAEFCRTIYGGGQSGIPKYYCEVAVGQAMPVQYEFYPVPSMRLIGSISYRSLILFNLKNPTNYDYITYYPLVFYATLIEIAIFAKDKEQQDIYTARYQELISNMSDTNESRLSDKTDNASS